MINGPFPFGVLGFCLNGIIATGQLSLRNSLPLTQTIPMQQIVYFFWYSNNHYFYSRGQFCGFTPRAVFSFMLLIASRWSQIYLILKFLDVGVMKKIVSFKAYPWMNGHIVQYSLLLQTPRGKRIASALIYVRLGCLIKAVVSRCAKSLRQAFHTKPKKFVLARRKFQLTLLYLYCDMACRRQYRFSGHIHIFAHIFSLDSQKHNCFKGE